MPKGWGTSQQSKCLYFGSVYGTRATQEITIDPVPGKVDGYLPTADVAFLDEIFKAPVRWEKKSREDIAPSTKETTSSYQKTTLEQ